MGKFIHILLLFPFLVEEILSVQITVTLFEHVNYEGKSRQMTVERCENVDVDFNDIASSLNTTGCVELHQHRCCQGAFRRYWKDTENIIGFHEVTSSISPCEGYRSPYPEEMKETWLGHTQLVKKAAEDGDIAIYYNDEMQRTAVENHKSFLKELWRYVKETYGDFGPEGGRLHAIFHANMSGANSLQSYFDAASNCRSLIDLVGGVDGWSRNLTGVELDVLVHEVGHIVEGSNNNVAGSPSYRLWGDSKWAEIFMYDVYKALGMKAEMDRVFELYSSTVDNFPKPNTMWFKNWFYPVYSQYGGAKVLSKYFELLAAYFPRTESGTQLEARTITLGEFVHFYSGAAGKFLQSEAEQAFGWDADLEVGYKNATMDFPYIKYET